MKRIIPVVVVLALVAIGLWVWHPWRKQDNNRIVISGNIEMTDSRIGELAVPGVIPRLSGTPGEIRWLGEGLGARNDEVFASLLGLDGTEITRLRDDGVI